MHDLPPRFLIGGGRDDDALGPLYARFLAACPGGRPRVGCLIVDDGDGDEQFARFGGALVGAGRCEPVPMLVPLGGSWDPATLAGLDGLLVCAGRTPAYQEVLATGADAVRHWMTDGGRPYAGFSAGAAVASVDALVGGFQIDGRTVCPEDAAEDLYPVTVRPGLGLTPFTVDVHCAQWGTLSRLAAAVGAGLIDDGVALDENTMLAHHGTQAAVFGAGRAWVVSRADGGVRIRAVAQGEALRG
jgi:cyanophycinase